MESIIADLKLSFIRDIVACYFNTVTSCGQGVREVIVTIVGVTLIQQIRVCRIID
ncbi:MAG: hypothetical protein IKX59_06815 [Bacteroidales bacterium]|nr:hypothetical protein [Bacteroidales bacterium]